MILQAPERQASGAFCLSSRRHCFARYRKARFEFSGHWKSLRFKAYANEFLGNKGVATLGAGRSEFGISRFTTAEHGHDGKFQEIFILLLLMKNIF
jgi:hypothetical protein